MRLIVHLITGAGAGRSDELPHGGTLRVGRSTAADIRLVDPLLSGNHFELRWVDDRPWLIDLGSTNGTRLNGQPATRVELAHGDVIAAGSQRFRVELTEPFDQALPPPPMPPEAPRETAPPPAEHRLEQRPAREIQSPRGPERRRLIWAVLALAAAILAGCAGLMLLAAILVGDSGRWDLLPSMARSVVTNGWQGRLHPTPGLTTGTQPVTARPHPAIRLAAPADALDIDRTFRVTALTGDELARYAAATPIGLWVPLAGLDLDSGMEPRDLFPGALTVTLDLDELGIAEGLWDLVGLYRLDPEGALRRIDASRRGPRMTFELRHNGPILTGALAVALAALYGADQAQKWGGVGEWLGGSYQFYDFLCYRVWYPRTLGWRESPEYLRVKVALEERWKSFTPRSNGAPPEDNQPLPRPSVQPANEYEQALAYISDPDVQKLMKASWHSPSWVRANALPWKVVRIVDSLERAHSYLFDHRKFRKPGTVDIILFNDWALTQAQASTFGFSSDGYFNYPYIQLNPGKVPDGETPPPFDLDNLDTTVLHELFHVVQKEYFNWSKYLNPGHLYSGTSYVWFMEATALVLEEDARTYYTGPSKWTRTHFETTYDQTEHLGYFKLPMDAAGPDATATQRKGYAASRFLLELQRRYYPSNPNAFLRSYLEAFCSFTNATDALVGVTSSDNELFGADYMLFSSRHARAIAAGEPAPLKITLDATHPVRSWPLGAAPLSTPFHRFDLGTVTPDDLKRAILVVRSNRLQQYGVFTRVAVGDGDYTTITDTTGTAAIAGSTIPADNRSLTVQRVESYVDTPWGMGTIASLIDEPQTTTLLMLQPKTPPKVELLTDDNKLRVTIEPSKLWRTGELHEHQVRIGTPQSKALTFGFGKETRVELDWNTALHGLAKVSDVSDARARSLLVQQDMVDMHTIWRYFTSILEGKDTTIQIRYREVAKANSTDTDPKTGIDGPWSEVFEVPLAKELLAGLSYDVSGTWKGTTLLLHEPVAITLEQRGADILGTCTHSGVVYRMEGTWRAEEKGWEVQMLTLTSDGLAGSLVTPYLRRMPGQELWLAWPTCVLRRDPPRGAKGEERSWFDRLWGG